MAEMESLKNRFYLNNKNKRLFLILIKKIQNN